MHKLMRIIFIQEAFSFIQKQGELTIPVESVLESEWSLYLSSAMPRQDLSKNNCCLFSCVGAEILSVGKDMSSMTPSLVEMLEDDGRRGFASLILSDEDDYMCDDNDEDMENN